MILLPVYYVILALVVSVLLAKFPRFRWWTPTDVFDDIWIMIIHCIVWPLTLLGMFYHLVWVSK